MSFSRIYQGRVSRVEIQDAEADSGWRLVENWEEALFRHHELFQDAVNWYSAALFAMANSEKSPLWNVRSHLEEVWGAFTRKGQSRRGMRESLCRCLGLDDALEFSTGDCFERILERNTSSPELLELALRELLLECNGDGAIQQKGREMLPRFCWSGFKGSYPKSAARFERLAGEQRLQGELHELADGAALEAFAAEVQLAWVVNLNEDAAPYQGAESRERLEKAVLHFLQVFGETSSTKMGDRVRDLLNSSNGAEERLRELRRDICELREEATPEIPKNRKSIPDRSEALLLFKYFPSAFTAELLRTSYPQKSLKSSGLDEVTQELIQFGDDPICLARGDRGYVFPAFTALPYFGGDGVEPVWKEFDIAAFKEALKALHQIEVKTEERRKKRERLESVRDAQDGKGKWKSVGEAEEEEPPALLAGDMRIEKLESLLKDQAIRNEFTGPDGVVRGLSKRGLRGFRSLRERWNKIAPLGSEVSDERKAKLEQCRQEYQVEQGDRAGDSTLFKALLDPEYWIVWQSLDEGLQDGWKKDAGVKSKLYYADDFMRAYEERLRLLDEIEHLKKPISFTPADAKHSQRQFYFSDVCSFTAKGKYHHEKDSLAVVVPMAIQQGNCFEVSRVRFRYSAPRLLRDGLRVSGGSLTAAPFAQPMMKALGVMEELPQDLHKHAVALMPKLTQVGGRDKSARTEEWAFLLNFPITLDTEALRSKLGPERFDWSSQFASFDGKNYYLLWPSLCEKRKVPKVGWWWNEVQRFSVLSVDLGQRDAGAFAFHDVKRNGKGRLVGQAGDSAWRANLEEMGMLKLQGEGAHSFKKGKQVAEPYGKRGRMPTESDSKWIDEVAEALHLAERTGMAWEEQLTADYWRRIPYPESNDVLLKLLRRAQGWMARIRGLCIDLALEGKQEAALKAVWEDVRLVELLRVPQKRDPLLVQGDLSRVIKEYRQVLAEILVVLANRVLPMRDGLWEWEERADVKTCHILRRNFLERPKRKRKVAGQRGLSLARIEQLESLRKRAQSLNRVWRYEPEDPESRKSLKDVNLPDPCPDVLEKLDRIKDQRVKQTAHLILAQALGVRLRAPELGKEFRRARDVHGEYERFRERAADFIVMEDLSRYLSKQDRARSENTRLMQWSHRALLETLKELCEPYGIQVVETNAAFSSKFCSRTGEPGFRAREVSVKDFEQGGRYAWKLDRLKKHELKHVRLSKEQLAECVALDEIATELRRDFGGKKRSLLVPEEGGPIFVNASNDAWMQADMNAAINVGLRGMAEPSCHELFPKIRTEKKGQAILVKADSKREKARWSGSSPEVAWDGSEDVGEGSRSPNLFVDRSRFAAFGRASVGALRVATSLGLWKTMKRLKWDVCERINRVRIDRWKKRAAGEEIEEDVPFS